MEESFASDAPLSEAERLMGEGNKTGALSQFKRAAESDPKSERAWLGVAKVTDDADEAMQALGQVIALNPNNIEARNQLLSLQVTKVRQGMLANELSYRENPVRRFIIPVLLILDIIVYGYLAVVGGERALGWIRP